LAAAFLQLYCSFTAALLRLYFGFTAALLVIQASKRVCSFSAAFTAALLWPYYCGRFSSLRLRHYCGFTAALLRSRSPVKKKIPNDLQRHSLS
jgi:hypothetical protein